MRVRPTVAYVVIAVVLLGIGFFAGSVWQWGNFSGATSQGNPLRQDLLKQLVTAKAAIRAGLTFADLGIQERQIRTAAELANATINDKQRQSITAAVYAISQTRTAWQKTLDSLCRSDRDVYLKYCKTDFQQVFENLGIVREFDLVGKRDYGSSDFVHSDEILAPLLGICFSRIQAAIDSLG